MLSFWCGKALSLSLRSLIRLIKKGGGTVPADTLATHASGHKILMFSDLIEPVSVLAVDLNHVHPCNDPEAVGATSCPGAAGKR